MILEQQILMIQDLTIFISQWFSTRGDFVTLPQGTFGDIWRNFICEIWGSASGIWRAEVRKAVKHPTMHRSAFPLIQRIIKVRVLIVPKLRNPTI